MSRVIGDAPYGVQGKVIMNREGSSPLPQAKMYHIRQPHKGLDGRFVNRPYGVRGMEGITIRRTVEDAGPYGMQSESTGCAHRNSNARLSLMNNDRVRLSILSFFYAFIMSHIVKIDVLHRPRCKLCQRVPAQTTVKIPMEQMLHGVPCSVRFGCSWHPPCLPSHRMPATWGHEAHIGGQNFRL